MTDETLTDRLRAGIAQGRTRFHLSPDDIAFCRGCSELCADLSADPHHILDVDPPFLPEPTVFTLHWHADGSALAVLKKRTMQALLHYGAGPLADWLEAHGYADSAADIRDPLPRGPVSFVWVRLPRWDERLALALETFGERTAADIVRRGY